MVLVTKSDGFKGRIASKKWLCFTVSLGITFLLTPIALLYIDPISIIAKYYLRVANGTILHSVMLAKLPGPRISVSLFNVTNAEEFMSGRDEKLKLNEIGPFVYQEYRINRNLVIHSERDVMTYSPELWAEFLPEESIDDPKNVYLTMPSVCMLAGAHMMSKYPFFLQQMFSVFAASLHSKAMVNITAHDFLWGRPDPLLKFANTVVPGLFYYTSSGTLARIFDVDANYTMEVGTKGVDKFSVKKAKKIRKNMKSDDVIEDVQTFSNAYEGAVFPLGMSPDMTLYLYRHSVCKVFKLQYTGSVKSEYGSEAFTYDFGNETVNEHQICYKEGWCPDGLATLAPCYYNFPFALSRGHFLDADPRIYDRIEGIKPDRKLHSSEIVVDQKSGVTLSAYASFTLSLALGDLGYNAETKRLKDTVLPLCNALIDMPKPIPVARTALLIMYVYGPYILLTIELLCLLTGLGLLAYTAKMLYWMRISERRSIILETTREKKNTLDAYLPLMLK